MTYEELKKQLGSQQRKTLELIEDSGRRGINTKSFRNYLFIQMPTTRVLEINRAFKKYEIPKKIKKRTERDRTATYYLTDISNQDSLFEEKKSNKGRIVSYRNSEGILEQIQL